jgi:hypothetical protein
LRNDTINHYARTKLKTGVTKEKQRSKLIPMSAVGQEETRGQLEVGQHHRLQGLSENHQKINDGFEVGNVGEQRAQSHTQ